MEMMKIRGAKLVQKRILSQNKVNYARILYKALSLMGEKENIGR